MELNRTRLKRVLELDEDRRADPYTDSEGNWTIGIGHLMSRAVAPDAYELATGIAVNSPTRISTTIDSIREAGIDAIYEDDILVAYNDMRNWLMGDGTASPSSWHRISYLRREVLTNMSFQLGRNSLGEFRRCRANVLNGNWLEASLEMRYADPDTERDSEWYEDTPNRCLRAVNAMRTDDPSFLLNR